MRYLSVCSGIESATVAWHPLGWEPVAFAEIDAFPSAVLAHRYPHVENVGDFTKIKGDEYGPIELLVGGTPCQSFSIAGLRNGLDDSRGNLALEFLRLVERARPRWLVWENVPGVLSSNGGRDFGAILGGMVELGYGIAYRVLDAQYVRVDGFARAVPQRRRRVFVVGCLGNWRRAAAVLFERESLRGDTAPRRETGQGIAGPIKASSARRGGVPEADDSASLIAGTVSSKWAKGTGGPSGDDCQNLVALGTAPPLTHNPYGDHESREGLLIAHSLRADGFDASEDGTGRGTPIVSVQCFDARQSDVIQYGDMTGPLDTDGHTMAVAQPICFSAKDHGADAQIDLSPTLRAGGFTESHANAGVMPAIAIQAGALRENPASGPDGVGVQSDLAYTVEARAEVQAVAFDMRGREGGAQCEGPHDTANIRASNGGSSRSYVAQQWAVRRLTPRECERLQGFPDDYTLIPYRGKPAADGPRYKALGNSKAVNVVRWLGQRIAVVDAIGAIQTIPHLQAAE